MTVAELIEELKTCAGSEIIWTEGCDCHGRALEIEHFVDSDGHKAILIKRDPLS